MKVWIRGQVRIINYVLLDIELMLKSLLGLGYLRECNFKHTISKI